jgi:Zn-dependent M28 family amino/carboxypeptidase
VSLGQLAHALSSQVAPLPVVGIRYDAARAILQHANINLDAVRGRADGTVTPLEGVTMSISTPIAASAAEVPNVVAVLRGSDPALRDEYVVYSAHFDHVGTGPPDASGDTIYNGADDNASGSSAVLELARAFASLERRPARSIMFVLVSGEEKGLLGSMYFVQNPPVPASQMVANINADMIGRNAPDTVVAIGQDYSSLGPTVQQVAARHPELGLVVAPDLWPQEQLFFRSDHFAFAAREIPAIFFTTGLHEQYHQPSDQAHLIDNDKLARISRLLFHFGLEVANASTRPQWTPDGLETVRRATGAGGQ